MVTQFNHLFRIEFCSCVKYHMVWLASSSEHSLPLAHSDGANATITPAVGSELNICGYLTFFVNISNLAAVYVISVKCTLYPLSIYLVYISFVFAV